MIEDHKIIKISKNREHSYISLIIWAIVYFVLLLMRDTYSIGINKYIFLAIICICAIYMNVNHLIYLFCFLFPLYVGLPGNYMTLILFLRLLFNTRKFKASSFFISLAVAAYVFMQNLILGKTSIVPMVFVVSVVLVLLIFSHKDELNPIPMILMYSAGVASLGFIMLLSTLQVYDFNNLLSTSFRLGSSSVDYVEEGIMNVSVDPNFYGAFSIAAISLSFPLLFSKKTNLTLKIFLSIFILVQLFVGLVGLSRAFILVLAVWVILYLLSQRNFKGIVIALIAIALIVILAMNFIPDVIQTVLDRFNDSDMDTYNGRLTLLQEFWGKWNANVGTILFGVGLFDCNIHCMPLQFLFGGGLILFVLMVALVISYTTAYNKIRLSNYLPFIVTFAMMSTVPAAALLNCMFPLVLVGLSGHNMKII